MAMHMYAAGDEVRIVGQYSGITTLASVVRVSPTGKQVHVQIGQRRTPSVFHYHPTLDRHFTSYDGYLFPSIR